MVCKSLMSTTKIRVKLVKYFRTLLNVRRGGAVQARQSAGTERAFQMKSSQYAEERRVGLQIHI